MVNSMLHMEVLFNNMQLLKRHTPAKLDENKTKATSSIEDLFKDSPSITPMTAKTQKDVKSDIRSLFEKSNVISPFAIHQQQPPMLAQQEALLMSAATNASGGAHKNFLITHISIIV